MNKNDASSNAKECSQIDQPVSATRQTVLSTTYPVAALGDDRNAATRDQR